MPPNVDYRMTHTQYDNNYENMPADYYTHNGRQFSHERQPLPFALPGLPNIGVYLSPGGELLPGIHRMDGPASQIIPGMHHMDGLGGQFLPGMHGLDGHGGQFLPDMHRMVGPCGQLHRVCIVWMDRG